MKEHSQKLNSKRVPRKEWVGRYARSIYPDPRFGDTKAHLGGLVRRVEPTPRPANGRERQGLFDEPEKDRRPKSPSGPRPRTR
jgi:hypothetical protein